MSKTKGTPEDKTAGDYFSLWCNGKVKFEDALIAFAKQHVSNALKAVEDNGFTLPVDDGTTVDINVVYPLEKIA
jgi:hypothetical protein